MPKSNSIQTSFHGGEFSPLLYGQVHADRYKVGLQTCLNYIPTLQGPLIRRPATKYVTNILTGGLTPTLVPFIFNENQAYVLEFGNFSVRFYANNGQVITTSNVFSVRGYYNVSLDFRATRTDAFAGSGELISASSIISAGSALQLNSPYSQADVAGLKYAQKDDTIYFTHPSYPVYKLQRRGNTEWQFSQVLFQDGPYLPLNSYKTTADSAGVSLVPSINTGFPLVSAAKGSVKNISGASSSAGLILISCSSHGYSTGDRVWITGISGTTEANNADTGYWSIDVIGTDTFTLRNSTFSNAYVGSGKLYYALFQFSGSGTITSYDAFYASSITTLFGYRNVGLINNGTRYYGTITNVINSAQALMRMLDDSGGGYVLPNTSTISIWQMGVWNRLNGFPTACCFHQDRLGFAGTNQYPQRVDLSMTGDYEHFAASGSSLQVADNNACSYKLLSAESNPIYWMKSSAQGLLAGSENTEWAITPSTQTQALTPTNVNATPTSFFGSANADAVQAGNATIYLQRAQRKVRELNFFFNVGTFRSTDLTEIAEHITIPRVTKLAVQKETYPLIWGVRQDGNLVSMTYNRDDLTIKAGWARHQLGGQSDSAGTNPVVKSIAVIPSVSNSTAFDQLWMVVQRSNVNGSSFTSIEYMTRPFDDATEMQDAFQGDCGITYDQPSPIVVLNLVPESTIILCTAHGLSNNDQVRINDVVGLNASTTDDYGNITIENLVNNKTFLVGSSVPNAFVLLNYDGSAVSNSSYSGYVGGGAVRKMVKTISGLDWLNGDTVGVLTDGGNHPDVVVQSGVITLNYRAAKVQIGYRYSSDGQTLPQEGGSAQGTSFGLTSRISRVAPQLHSTGDFQMGAFFNDLMPLQFFQADQQQADQAAPLFSGIFRDAIGAIYDFDGVVCFRQNSMLPGTVLSLTSFDEVQDV